MQRSVCSKEDNTNGCSRGPHYSLHKEEEKKRQYDRKTVKRHGGRVEPRELAKEESPVLGEETQAEHCRHPLTLARSSAC